MKKTHERHLDHDVERIEGRALPGWVEIADTSPVRDRHYGYLSPIAIRIPVGGPHANWNGSFALDSLLRGYQFHWRCYRRRARAPYAGNLAGQPHARSSDPAGEGSSYCPLCLGHGRAQFIAGLVVSRPVSYSGELDVLSSRSVRGCSRLNTARQCAWNERWCADFAESSDGAAGTANSEHRHDRVCIRGHLCTKSRACECFLIVNLCAVFAHCHGISCRAGCDLAWISTGELPTFALNLELRKHVEIQYDYYPQYCALRDSLRRHWAILPLVSPM